MKIKANSLFRGFSMIELLVVLGVIVLLAGMLIAALPGIQTKVNRNRVEAFLAELESGLSKYQIDNGIYPLNEPSGDRDQDGLKGSSVLYKNLSGDRNLNGQVDRVEEGAEADERINEEVYVERLDYESNKDARDGRSRIVGGEYMVMDSYGDPVRYLAQPPKLKDEKDRETRNPTYDIWSIAGQNPKDPDAEAAFISNWQSR